MLDLASVTLCCVDTANHALALRALERSRAGVRFARTMLFTDALPAQLRAAEGIDVEPIAPLASRDDYSRFMLKSLLPHVTTAHVLVIQWDGYVVNPDAWDPAFLDCDYIGARWFWHDDGLRVGNGGFSLRSRRLLEALQDPRVTLVEAEDVTIGRAFRRLLESEYAIRFATEAMADRFSFEAAYPIGRPFGFHGLFNFCRTVPPAEIAALCVGFSDAIARSPQIAALARNCAAMGQWQAARALAQRMLDAAPDHAEAQALLATAVRQMAQPAAVGRNDPCPCGSGRKYKHCHGTIGALSSSTPARSAETIAREAMAAHQRGELDGAERAYREALALAPAHPLATHYLGVILMQRQRLSEALPLLERAARDAPREPEFHNNLGLALAADDRPAEAVDAYGRALALKPDHAVASNNLGLAWQAQNRLPEAIAAFSNALALAPTFEQARWNLALALLAHGDFTRGWQSYESRLGLAELGADTHRYDGPRWDGVAQPGKTLLLCAEQGLGDAIQFARFARPLAAAGMRVALRVPQPLARLVATIDGVTLACGNEDPLPHYDLWMPLLSVPGALRVDAQAIPGEVPYMHTEASRRAKAARRLDDAAGRLKVGLVWAGNRAHVNDRRRSIPLAMLEPLFEVARVAWYSLQQGDAAQEIGAAPAALPLAPLDPDSDFDDTAALVGELDLVVTVDTSIGHVAGALARPTWMMLPFAADWRWGVGRSDSPWYPTMRLFRQPSIGDWASVVREIAHALRLRAG